MAKREETLEMARLYQTGLPMQKVGEHFGISRQAVSDRFRRMKIAARENTKPPPLEKSELERLYLEERLPMFMIAEQFGCSVTTLYAAKKHYGIPVREWDKVPGSRVDRMRNLKLGETREFAETIQSPHSVLHRAARAAKVKIKIKKAGENLFNVTRMK